MLRAQPCAQSFVDAKCELFAERLSDTDEEVSYQNMFNATSEHCHELPYRCHVGVVPDRRRAGVATRALVDYLCSG